MTAIVSKEKEIDGNDIHETSSSDSNKTTEAIIHPDDNEDEPHIGIFQTPEIPDETTEAIIRFVSRVDLVNMLTPKTRTQN